MRLEASRYQAHNPPADRTVGVYGGITCAQDIALMRSEAAGRLGQPPAPGPPTTPGRIQWAIKQITPAGDGSQRDIVTITAADTVTGGVTSAEYYLQVESGAWKVCGFFLSDSVPTNSGSSGGQGS